MRLRALDQLRGLFASSILIYHYGSFTGRRSGITDRLGIYGVAAFFVISGASFGFAYRDLAWTPRALGGFFLRRFARLAPLYWLVCAGVVLLAVGERALSRPGFIPTPGQVLGNLTLTFGFYDANASLLTGGWSIGCEMAFYVLLPVALLAVRRSPWLFAGLLAASLAVGAAFAWHVLHTDVPLAGQFPLYINPLNHVWLFLSGFLVARGVGRLHLGPRFSYLALLGCAVVFCLIPTTDDQISMVTGVRRFAFGAVCIAICALAAWGSFPLPHQGDAVLSWLGGISYGVYLLHPFIFDVASLLLHAISTRQQVPLLGLLLCAALTLAAADVVHRLLERPVIDWSKRVTDRGLPVGHPS